MEVAQSVDPEATEIGIKVTVNQTGAGSETKVAGQEAASAGSEDIEMFSDSDTVIIEESKEPEAPTQTKRGAEHISEASNAQ